MKTSPRPKITVAIGAFFIFFELVPSARGGADLPTNYLLNGERTDADQIVGPHAFLTFSTLTAFQVNLVTVTCGGSEALVPFALAYADVNTSGVVNHEDKLQVRFHIGMALTSEDFRDDVNANGTINQQDGVLVRVYKGQSLPP